MLKTTGTIKSFNFIVVAISLTMEDSDLQSHQVTSIKNLHQNFNYIWNGEKFGRYYYRKLYCYCKCCRNNWKENCTHEKTVGYFGKNIQKEIGVRVVERYKQQKL